MAGAFREKRGVPRQKNAVGHFEKMLHDFQSIGMSPVTTLPGIYPLIRYFTKQQGGFPRRNAFFMAWKFWVRKKQGEAKCKCRLCDYTAICRLISGLTTLAKKAPLDKDYKQCIGLQIVSSYLFYSVSLWIRHIRKPLEQQVKIKFRRLGCMQICRRSQLL